MTPATSPSPSLGNYGQPPASDLGDQVLNLADKATDQLASAVKGVETAANTLAEQGRQAGEQAQEVAENFRTAFDKSLKDQPIMTLAIAAGIGIVMGALWKA